LASVRVFSEFLIRESAQTRRVPVATRRYPDFKGCHLFQKISRSQACFCGIIACLFLRILCSVKSYVRICSEPFMYSFSLCSFEWFACRASFVGPLSLRTFFAGAIYLVSSLLIAAKKSSTSVTESFQDFLVRTKTQLDVCFGLYIDQTVVEASKQQLISRATSRGNRTFVLVLG